MADEPVSAAPLTARQVSSATGKALWTSLDELAGTEEFKQFLHREFPAYASELLDGSRRHFLKIMGASLALAGAGGLGACRRPDHRILAYNQAPEHSVPGKPLFYATAMPLAGGGCEGLLAETFEGRPTKLEGNPLHPSNRGKSTLSSQASVLDLYDPDREGWGGSWEEFRGFARRHFAAFNPTKGKGLVFLVNKATSPTRNRLRDRILQKWPEAKWLAYEPTDSEGAIEGSRSAFGDVYELVWDLSKARVVVSFDDDFLSAGPGRLGDARGFASGRYAPGGRAGHEAADSQMSRLYVIEPSMTLTGGQADHRFAVRPARVGAVLAAVAQEVMVQLSGSGDATLMQGVRRLASEVGGSDLPSAEHIGAIADDLVANAGFGAIMVGDSQPAAVHALAHALNRLLRNAGSTVRYYKVVGDAAQSSLSSITQLTGDIKAGRVSTLVTIGCNPVYDAPADLDFAAAYATVKERIYLGPRSETGAAATTVLAQLHYLESWSDVEAWDGTYSVIQPQISPLFESSNDLELLAILLRDEQTDPYELVRETLRQRTTRDAVAFETTWRRTLHDGLLGGSTGGGLSPDVKWAEVARLAGSSAD